MDIKYCDNCGKELSEEDYSISNWGKVKYCNQKCNEEHWRVKRKKEIRGNMNSDTLYLNDYITKPFIQEEE